MKNWLGIKFYTGTPNFGWKMYGVGNKALTWFIGISIVRKL